MTETPGARTGTGGATAAGAAGAAGYAGTPGGTADTASTESPSLGTLLSSITENLSTLMRQEVALAKAELTADAKNAGKGAGMFAGAGVAGHMVLVFLSIALWQLLGIWMHLALSALIVALLWAVIAAVLAATGRKEIKQVEGMPRTTDTVKKIPPALKGNEEENR